MESTSDTANNGNNEIYIITHHNSPNVMREIGRLREVTFRHAGGGTGLEIDIDEFDTSSHPYQQLLVWNPEDKEIVGAYRFILCKDAVYLPRKNSVQAAGAGKHDFAALDDPARVVDAYVPHDPSPRLPGHVAAALRPR